MKVEVRDSMTHEVLKTITEDSDLSSDSMFSTFVVPNEDPEEDLITFSDDPSMWLRQLPKALQRASHVYAEVVEE